MSREIKIQNIERMIKQNEEKIEKLNFINSKLKRQKLELLRKKELTSEEQSQKDREAFQTELQTSNRFGQ
jgi:hypothetical protein